MTERSAIGEFLLAVIAARLDEAGRTRAELARYATEAGLRGFTESALSRLFDGEARTHRDGWDYFAEGCAGFLGVHPYELWREALTAWESNRAGRSSRVA